MGSFALWCDTGQSLGWDSAAFRSNFNSHYHASLRPSRPKELNERPGAWGHYQHDMSTPLRAEDGMTLSREKGEPFEQPRSFGSSLHPAPPSSPLQTGNQYCGGLIASRSGPGRYSGKGCRPSPWTPVLAKSLAGSRSGGRTPTEGMNAATVFYDGGEMIDDSDQRYEKDDRGSLLHLSPLPTRKGETPMPLSRQAATGRLGKRSNPSDINRARGAPDHEACPQQGLLTDTSMAEQMEQRRQAHMLELESHPAPGPSQLADSEVAKIASAPQSNRPPPTPAPPRPDTTDCLFQKPKPELPPRCSTVELKDFNSHVPLTTGYMSAFHTTTNGRSLLPETLSRNSPRRGSYLLKGLEHVARGSRYTRRNGPDYIISKPHRNLTAISEWAPRTMWVDDEQRRRRQARLREELDASRAA